MDISDLLSREQVAGELGISLGRLDSLRRDGRVSVIKINEKCVRISRAEMERLKADLAVGA